MIVRHVKIANFRGIKSLDWHVKQRVVCLVGPNDTTKTTILDAIELCCLPRYSYELTDVDFHKCQFETPIVIEVTMGEVPNDLLSEEKFGLYLRGYTSDNKLVDDPSDADAPVLTLRFYADKTLEPIWTIYKNNGSDARAISWRDRIKFGMTRLGLHNEQHLSWSRGSALEKLTTSDSETAKTYTAITRAAQDAIRHFKVDPLVKAASRARDVAENMGARFTELEPGLDMSGMSIGNSLFSLHESAIPVAAFGLGTQRLTSIAIQQCDKGASSLLLIDELEIGLEPHRIRHLLKRLGENQEGDARSEGQILMISHSPTTVMALPIEQLAFVRTNHGDTTVLTAPIAEASYLQSAARTAPYAIMGRKLLVCEGATEVGLCRGMEDYWSATHNRTHPTHLGFVAIDGGGRTKAPKLAMGFKTLGYTVDVFADSDQPLDPAAQSLQTAGMEVFLWPGQVATEERLAMDLPLPSLQNLLEAIVEEESEELIIQQICSALEGSVKAPIALTNWIGSDLSEEKLREAIGKAGKRGAWFKSRALGERLGHVTAQAMSQIAETHTVRLLDRIAKWIYG